MKNRSYHNNTSKLYSLSYDTNDKNQSKVRYSNNKARYNNKSEEYSKSSSPKIRNSQDRHNNFSYTTNLNRLKFNKDNDNNKLHKSKQLTINNMNTTSQYNKYLMLLNYKNKKLDINVINEIFKKYDINYSIIDTKFTRQLFTQSLTHPSYSITDENYKIYKDKYYSENLNTDMVFLKTINYEHLEFLGDALIKSPISQYLYQRYSHQGEGFMSTLRTKIESTNTLSLFLNKLNLKQYILLSQIEEQEGTRENIHVLEDCFEAFIGALFIYGSNTSKQNNSNDLNNTDNLNDNNIGKISNIIKELIFKLIENELNLSELIRIRNYKDELNKYCHSEKIALPNYIKLNLQKNQVFNVELNEYTVIVEVNGKKYGPAKAIQLKDAEQQAAKIAINELVKIKDDNYFIL